MSDLGSTAKDEPISVPDLTLRHLRELCRENLALHATMLQMMERLNRVQTPLMTFVEESREGFRAVRAELNIVRSDVLALEMQNGSRHGENFEHCASPGRPTVPRPFLIRRLALAARLLMIAGLAIVLPDGFIDRSKVPLRQATYRLTR